MSPDDNQARVPPGTGFQPFPIEDTERSIPARFEKQVLLHPERVAIQTRARRVAYREINADANRIARAILSVCRGQPEPVALLIGDDAAMLTALFGVLKAGKIFVLLDPAQPDARLAQVLENAKPGLLLTEPGRVARARAVAKSDIAILDIDTIQPESLAADLGLPLSADAPAGIIYTSGSTGVPKGVLHSHRNILHNILIHTNTLRIGPRDRLTLLSARSTGQAMTGTFSALLNGAALHPFDVRGEGLAALAAWLTEDGITIYHSSASTFRHLAGGLAADKTFPDMRVVKLGSEPVSLRDVERVREIFPRECVFVNALSSSETWTMCQIVIGHDTPVEGALVPVGYAVRDVEVRLLDDGGNPVAPGAVGTICVRSRYLAVGYWRDEDATRAAFQLEPDGKRVYRTGDLGRLAPDGWFEHLGREDFQVKIRGNRVEPAEVESVLCEHDGVAQSVVAGQRDGSRETRLVAYIVPAQSAAPPSAAQLRGFMRTRVPAHMVPSGFVFLDAFPMTAAHKLDRRALPLWKPQSRAQESGPPRNDFRVSQLSAIWEQLLDVTSIAPGDDFFDLGGDSLLAVEMVVRIEEAFGKQIQLQDFMPELTIERIAQALADDTTESFEKPLVTLRSTGSEHPFFFAHGDFKCGGFYCRNLARFLGDERPFYALHPHGLDGKPVPATVEKMAEDRLQALLEVKPHGPYVLGGFCSGGVVAVEMARRLRERGETVDLVVLIDARAENAPFRTAIKFLQGPARLAGISQQTRQRSFRRVRRFLGAFRESSQRGMVSQIRFILGKPYTMLTGARRTSQRADPDQPPVEKRHPLWTEHHEVLQDYNPGPYPGRLALLRSTHLDDKPPGGDDAGWRSVSPDVTVHSIPGSHHTCVTRHIEELANTIKTCLGDL